MRRFTPDQLFPELCSACPSTKQSTGSVIAPLLPGRLRILDLPVRPSVGRSFAPGSPRHVPPPQPRPRPRPPDCGRRADGAVRRGPEDRARRAGRHARRAGRGVPRARSTGGRDRHRPLVERGAARRGGRGRARARADGLRARRRRGRHRRGVGLPHGAPRARARARRARGRPGCGAGLPGGPARAPEGGRHRQRRAGAGRRPRPAHRAGHARRGDPRAHGGLNRSLQRP